jgi:hypothetical protein
LLVPDDAPDPLSDAADVEGPDVDSPALEPASPEPDPEPEAPSDLAFDAFVPDDEPLLERRSTFAQPEPLNTTAGADTPFFIVPSAPQFGQNRGPLSLIPWMTSVTWPQVVHA